MRRVVVTGMGGLTALGHDWTSIGTNLKARRSGVSYLKELDEYQGLRTRLGSRVAPYEVPAHYDRKITRSMSPVGLMSTISAERALADSGLLGDPLLKSGRAGIAHGASAGGAQSVVAFGSLDEIG